MKFSHISAKNEFSVKLPVLRLFISAVVVSLAVVLSMLLFATIITYTDIDIKYVNIFALSSFYLGSFVAGVLSGLGASTNGWLRGVVSGFFYFCAVFVFSLIITAELNISLSVVLKLLSVIFVGAAGGVFGINMK